MNAETENVHLKELLKRLRDENVSLRNTSFTFSVPRNGEPSDRPFNGAVPSFDSPPESSIFASTSHLPSPSSSAATKVATPQTSSSLDTPSAFPGDIDFGSLTPLDPSAMDLLDDADAIMSYDFGYGQFVPSKTPYKTIASNPMFMSFAEPTAPDATSIPKSSAQSANGNPYDITFGQWTGQTSSNEGNSQAGSLDELFGGHTFSSQSPLNFNVLMKSPATSPLTAAASGLSPVVINPFIPSLLAPVQTTALHSTRQRVRHQRLARLLVLVVARKQGPRWNNEFRQRVARYSLPHHLNLRRMRNRAKCLERQRALMVP
jgi:AP-1-like factor